GLVDHDADLSAEWQQADIEHRSGENRHGDAAGRAGLFSECSRASRTHAQSGGRATLEDRWISVEGVHQGERRVGAAAGGQIPHWGRDLAWAGESARISNDSQKNDWRQTARADLRLRAAEYGDAAIFHDDWHPSFAGLRPDRDDRDLHHG